MEVYDWAKLNMMRSRLIQTGFHIRGRRDDPEKQESDIVNQALVEEYRKRLDKKQEKQHSLL